MRYRVQFEMEVEADTPREACQLAYDQFIACEDNVLPMGTVTDLGNGKTESIDLSN